MNYDDPTLEKPFYNRCMYCGEPCKFHYCDNNNKCRDAEL
jgi:hypothetical protein